MNFSYKIFVLANSQKLYLVEFLHFAAAPFVPAAISCCIRFLLRRPRRGSFVKGVDYELLYWN